MKTADHSHEEEVELSRRPEELEAITDFLNTLDRGIGPDRLSTVWELNKWMLRHDLLEKVTLDAADLIRACEVRDALRVLLEYRYDDIDVDAKTLDVLNHAASLGQLRLRFEMDGSIRLRSLERNFEGALGELLSFVVMAQQGQGNLWSRIKLCSSCERVFLDLSKARQIEWCSPRCGEQIRCRSFPRRP